MQQLRLCFLMFFVFYCFIALGDDAEESYNAGISLSVADSDDMKLIEHEYDLIRKEQQGSAVGGVDIEKDLLNKTSADMLDVYQHQTDKMGSIFLFAENMASKFVLWFGSALFLWSLAMNYYKNVIQGKTTLNYMKIIRDSALLLLLLNYGYVARGLHYVTNGFPYMILSIADETYETNNFVQFQLMLNEGQFGLTPFEKSEVLKTAKNLPGGGNNMHYSLAALSAMKNKKDQEAGGLDISFDIVGVLKQIWNTVINIPVNGLMAVTAVINTLLKYIFFTLTFAMECVLLIIGPLALLASFIGITKDKWKTWLSRYLVVKLSLGVYLILDNTLFLIQSTDAIQSGFSSFISNPEYTMGFAIISIVLYVMAFWLTSTFMGSADAGKFLSTAAGLATAGMTMAMGIKAMNKSSGGGTGSSSGSTGGGDIVKSLGNMTSKTSRENPDNDNR